MNSDKELPALRDASREVGLAYLARAKKAEALVSDLLPRVLKLEAALVQMERFYLERTERNGRMRAFYRKLEERIVALETSANE